MSELPQNVRVITQPTTAQGNDAADWQDDPEAVATFKQSVQRAATGTNTADLLNKLLGGMKVSKEQAEKFCDPTWVYENLIIDGHCGVYAAEPNGGKTTTFWGLSRLFVQKGYRVIYINADVAATDAKSMVPQAEQWGIDLLLPEMGESQGMEFAVKQLRELALASADLTRHIFILDTMKKAASPNDKREMRAFLQLCRRLTSLGATVCLLAHTLKYYDNEGNPVFEGVGDVKADVDELIYLVPKKNPDGSMIVSTKPDKVRGAFQPISFVIGADRSVSQLGKHVNLKAEKKLEARFAQDFEDLTAIHDALKGGRLNVTQIKAETSLHGRTLAKMLKRYEGRQWAMERGEKNAKFYRSLPPHKRTPSHVEGEVSDV